MVAAAPEAPLMEARAAILGRIRLALSESGAVPASQLPIHAPPPKPSTSGPPEASEADDEPQRTRWRLDQFLERAADYCATVTVTSSVETSHTLGLVCGRHGISQIMAPLDLPAAWHPDGVELSHAVNDRRRLEQVDAALTGCALAVAQTGTIVLDSGPCQGSRALTLLPDLHVCVVEVSKIVPDLPAAMRQLAPAVSAGRPLTFVSGPSATSDIELQRVEGVHGPRQLEVVVVRK